MKRGDSGSTLVAHSSHYAKDTTLFRASGRILEIMMIVWNLWFMLKMWRSFVEPRWRFSR